MRRGLIAFDRLTALLLAAVLIALGASALAWRQDLIPDATGRLEITGLTDLPRTEWWPWATAGAGALLVVLGLLWLTRHLPRRGTGRLRLNSTDSTGRLTADATAAAATAGEVLARAPGVQNASGRILLDRGQLVAELTATLDPTADLETVRAAAGRTAQELHRVIARDDLHHRVQLHVARSPKTTTVSRVR
ncbi:hypothetical protein [Kribbella sp. NPDC051770]|uniref:hypothetical protein n=1 Tax=Kribbella sp. NPDC051770 TaxID=3155413 RepID=UPI00343D55D4